jgi:hypothetical protein
MSRFSPPAIALAAAALLAAALWPSVAQAHERRDVGPYQFVAGWIVEPAFEGLKNGVDLRVLRDGQPVEGVEQTLQVEVTHEPSGESRVFDLRTIFGDPGHYTADLIPTAAGPYQMRFFGSIEGREVDETFVSRSLGGGFNDMESARELQFPQRLPEVRELEGVTRGAQDAAFAAEDAAAGARMLAIAALAVGALGIVAGGAGIVLAARR